MSIKLENLKKKEILFISQTATHALKLENVEKFLIKTLSKFAVIMSLS